MARLRGSIASMMKRRSIHNEGEKRKFLCVIDDTPECHTAVIYAATRAKRSGGAVTLLYVIEPGQFQHWLGVEAIRRAEAYEEAEEVISKFAEQVRACVQLEPEMVIREGHCAEEIVKLVEEDEQLSILVLAAGTDTEGPGPLVSAIVGKSSGTYPIPVTIVPGHLTDADIDALC